ncbi:MAG: patatin-like phospholipase family protein [Erythrobacter sp.]|nr:MAG: patatin-like phospholipase family protein [Erythrobacter sp.]
MVYHVGAIIRLHELDLLSRIERVSSVSGGSITAGVLGQAWYRIGSRDDLWQNFVEPVLELASTTIDRPSIVRGVLLPGSVGEYVARRYDEILFKGATLQDLPDKPRFVINATNLETGTLWRFSKPYMRDYKVGEVANPTVRLADTVAASSAFPPVLSPFVLEVDAGDFTIREPDVANGFFDGVTLTDGGVYDNYGLEPVWDRYSDVLVSDGGGILAPDPEPSAEWALQSYRVIGILQQQVHALRSRQLVESFQSGETKGCLWSIQTPLEKYDAEPAVAIPSETVTALARTPTRLKRMSGRLMRQLVNLGYVGADMSLRSWYLRDAAPGNLPFPEENFA